MQAPRQWQHPLADFEALDVHHLAMCSALHWCIIMVIEIPSDLPAFFVIINFIVTQLYKDHVIAVPTYTCAGKVSNHIL